MALGEIRLFAGSYAPAGFALCDGAMMQVAEDRALFQQIGTRYGGDGRTTFALPDLRGRTPIHRADGAALGTKGTISVDAERRAHRARLALNFVISVSKDQYDYPEALLAEVRLFACNFAPEGWAHCEGQLLPISQNTALFSLLGTAYDGDGRTTFGLPDLRDAHPFQPASAEGRGNQSGAQPAEGSTAPQPPLLVMNYCVALQGVYPRRP